MNGLHVSTICPPFQKEVPPYVFFERMFSPPECDALIRLGESKAMEPGAIGNGLNGEYVVNPDYRKVLNINITPDEASWAYERLRNNTAGANFDHYRYDIIGFHEQLILLRYDYDAEKPGKYNWHQDIGGGQSSLRKLSTVTQLSEPADYDGCRLRLFTSNDFDPEKIQRGDTVIFPSYLPHMVTPITRGRRYSLVSWVTGPAFR